MNIQIGEVRSRYDERKGGRSKLAMAPFPSSSNLKYLQGKQSLGCTTQLPFTPNAHGHQSNLRSILVRFRVVHAIHSIANVIRTYR